MASSDFLRSIAFHFGLRLIGALTVLAAPTAQDLVRSPTLPSAHAVARNAGGDHRFSFLSFRRGCCLRRYTRDRAASRRFFPRRSSIVDFLPSCSLGMRRTIIGVNGPFGD